MKSIEAGLKVKSHAKDMVAVVEFCKTHNISISCVDYSICSTATDFYGSLSGSARSDLIRYVILCPSMQRLSLGAACFKLLVASKLSRPSTSGYLDRLVTKWLIDPELWESAISIAKDTKSVKEALKSVQTPTLQSSSNNPFYQTSPRAYHRLCQDHNLHEHLFKWLITDRDLFMTRSISRVMSKLPAEARVAAVVGENHVKGMAALFESEISPNHPPRSQQTPTFSDWLKLKLLEKLLIG